MSYNSMGVGHSGTDTSVLSAQAISSKAEVCREEVIEILRVMGNPLTASEIAELSDYPELTIRPRLTELKNDGRVVDSGVRRPGNYHRPMIAWRLA